MAHLVIHALPRGLNLPTIGHSTFVCMGFNGIHESLGGLAERGGKALACVIMTIDFMSFRMDWRARLR